MTDVTSTVQKQDPGSELVILYDLEYQSGSFARFFGGLETDLTTVQFRDSSNTAREYTAIPIMADGFDVSSDGAYNRPELSIGNVGSALSSAIGGLTYEDLIGKRITRIPTFQKYLVGGASDSSSAPGVSLPKTVFIIDRISSKNILQVTFELSSPFDLQGIQLPRRVIVGGACTWRYKEGRRSLARASRIGGCSWEGYVGNGTSGTAIYVNSDNEYVMNFADSEAYTDSSGAILLGRIYSTSSTDNATQLNLDGSTTTATVKEYWQAISSTDSGGLGTPSITNSNYRRVHRYSTYSSTTAYKGYSSAKRNEYVVHSGKLWRVKKSTVPAAWATGTSYSADDLVVFGGSIYKAASSHTSSSSNEPTDGAGTWRLYSSGASTTPAHGKYWTEGDICKKTLESCRMRFHATDGKPPGSPTFTNNIVRNSIDSAYQLPFGGFPGVQERR